MYRNQALFLSTIVLPLHQIFEIAPSVLWIEDRLGCVSILREEGWHLSVQVLPGCKHMTGLNLDTWKVAAIMWELKFVNLHHWCTEGSYMDQCTWPGVSYVQMCSWSSLWLARCDHVACRWDFHLCADQLCSFGHLFQLLMCSLPHLLAPLKSVIDCRDIWGRCVLWQQGWWVSKHALKAGWQSGAVNFACIWLKGESEPNHFDSLNRRCIRNLLICPFYLTVGFALWYLEVRLIETFSFSIMLNQTREVN